jgi:hypothetical protein
LTFSSDVYSCIIMTNKNWDLPTAKLSHRWVPHQGLPQSENSKCIRHLYKKVHHPMSTW